MTFALVGVDAADSVLLSIDSGSLTPVLGYLPYGDASLENAANLPRFVGERRDPVTGVYHLGNGYRAYNPRLMRFTCPDSLSPFGVGGINAYAYCAGDPVNRADPTGHMSWQAAVGIGTSVLGIFMAIFTAGTSIAVAGGVRAAFRAASRASVIKSAATTGAHITASVTGSASLAVEDTNEKAAQNLAWVSFACGAITSAVDYFDKGNKQLSKLKPKKTDSTQPSVRTAAPQAPDNADSVLQSRRSSSSPGSTHASTRGLSNASSDDIPSSGRRDGANPQRQTRSGSAHTSHHTPQPADLRDGRSHRAGSNQSTGTRRSTVQDHGSAGAYNASSRPNTQSSAHDFPLNTNEYPLIHFSHATGRRCRCPEMPNMWAGDEWV